MVDISMQGAKLVFSGTNFPKDVQVNFSDEGSPLEFPDVEVVGYSGTMNGDLVTWCKYNPIQFRLTVIPGSATDIALVNVLYMCHIGGMGGSNIRKFQVMAGRVDTMTLTIPAIKTAGGHVQGAGGGDQVFTFHNGTITSGSPGYGSNSEGKMSARTYNFVFEWMN